MNNTIVYQCFNYTVFIDPKDYLITLKTSKGTLIEFPVSIQLNILKSVEETEKIIHFHLEGFKKGTILYFRAVSNFVNKKTYVMECSEDGILFYAFIEEAQGQIDTIRFFNRPGGFQAKTDSKALYYSPRFDWSRGIVHTPTNQSDSISCQQWFSPGPSFFGIQQSSQWLGLGIVEKAGRWNFLSYDWNAGESGFSLDLTYEGHTKLENFKETPQLFIDLRPSASENEALQRYIDKLVDNKLIYRTPRKIPEWWYEPLFCGWGQQRRDYRRDHENEENGNWINAGDYSTELFYRKYMKRLEKQGVDPGIIIIDCFWAQTPLFAEPHPLRWKNMRSFIDEQHAKGRHVLLWFTPIIYENLPIEACITLEGKPIAADPTSLVYQSILAKEIRKMLSSEEGCLNADGFKIDFTQNISAERGIFRNILKDQWAIISEEENKSYSSLDDRNSLIKTHKPIWGIEIIKAYLQAIRKPMKKVKPDSLLITHTAHPYFSEEVDMLRLNDMDGTSPDVLGIMGNRAAIAHSCNPAWLIDTDNDLMTCKSMWREYMSLQIQLGNPDTYYSEGIAQSGEAFDSDDYAHLKQVFDEYRTKVERGIYAGRPLYTVSSQIK